MYDSAALLAGSEAALADAIDEMSAELYHYAVGILLSAADAEDAVQHAFIQLWQQRHRIKDPAAVRSYLYRCTYRACAYALRRRNRFYTPPREEPRVPMSDELVSALLELTAEERAIVYSRAVEDVSYAELAEQFGLKEATVRKKYERAKKKLAAILMPRSETEEKHDEFFG